MSYIKPAATNMTVSRYLSPVRSVKTVTHHSPSPVKVKTYITESVVRASPSPHHHHHNHHQVHWDGALDSIKRKYEDETRHVQRKYEVDYSNHVTMIKTIEELELLLEQERARCRDWECKYNDVVVELEQERKLRMDLEHEVTVLREELRQAGIVISNQEVTISRLQEQVVHLEDENKALRVEITRITDLYNLKLTEIEDKYMAQVRELTVEINNLKALVEHQKRDYEQRLQDLDRDWSAQYSRLEEVLREKERVIASLEEEIHRLKDEIVHLRHEFEEELRRQIALVREEERRRYEAIIRELEAKLAQLENERNLLAGQNQELIRELNIKERQLQDLRRQYEAELARLRAEVNDLRNQVNALTAANERLRRDVAERDSIISNLEAEIANLEREINRLKDAHAHEMNRLMNEYNNERRRWEEEMRALTARIEELERLIASLEAENNKLRMDLERLKEKLAGNLHKTIVQTFVEHDSPHHHHVSNIRSLY